MPGYIDGVYVEDVAAVLRPTRALDYSRAADRVDFFHRGSGRLSMQKKLPSGQTWDIFLANVLDEDFVIKDGGLQIAKHNNPANTAAAYAWCTGPELEEAGVEFYFTDGTTGGSVVSLCISKRSDSPNVATNSVHGVITPVAVQIGIFNGVSLSNFYSVVLPTPLATGRDARYTCRIRRTGPNTIQVYRPDGVVDTVVDSRIDTWWGGTALIEPFHGVNGMTTDKRPIITGFFAKNSTKLDAASQAPEPWHVVGAAGEPPFISPWGTFTGFQVPRFRKVGNQVFLDGVLGHTNATNASVAFVLPVGYRPQATVVPYAFARLDVDSSGQVVCRGVSAGSFHALTSSFWTD